MALFPYKSLTHVTDYITYNDTAKAQAFEDVIRNILTEREQILEKAMIENFSIYNQTQNEKLAAVLIVVNNYDDIDFLGEGMAKLLEDVALRGTNLGVYLAVTMPHVNAMRYSAMSNFQEKIAGFMYEPEEIHLLIGRSHIRLTDSKKGRALVNLDGINLMQLYAPVLCDNEITYKNELANLIKKINANGNNKLNLISR